ncbi:MAG: bacteriochlorophyll 4-vinyl reductase [Gammaproteobacteria bacterium]|nr:bacteriochlorophyll 4-vinyl reductase [Gammaproteobacteria bacterium]MDH5175737.1 bacteriochlorophyll 4-vinyl reductase [Gammaproteobacteria bacterium]MDH5226546.1 bacteriochlorophyll 4-vinyl reductase [Gammaproteobacteria bacterium]
MATTALDFEPGCAQARIGPNAIIRLQQALLERVGGDCARQIFEQAGQGHFVTELPERMVVETSVTSLYTSLPTQLGPQLAAEVSGHAGWLTGDYLLANRIPQPVQALLHALPAPLAARVLIAAIRRNAWTFVGSGRFGVTPVPNGIRDNVARDGRRPRLHLRVEGCPICAGSQQTTPACAYYAAAFESLFVALVHRRTHVREVACHALGASACAFEVSW